MPIVSITSLSGKIHILNLKAYTEVSPSKPALHGFRACYQQLDHVLSPSLCASIVDVEKLVGLLTIKAYKHPRINVCASETLYLSLGFQSCHHW